MGEQHRLGNRERREAAIGIEQTPISFGQKIPLRRFYLVTLRHNESLSHGLQIAETQPWTFGKYSRPRYVRFGRRIMPRGSLEYFGIVSACAENTQSASPRSAREAPKRQIWESMVYLSNNGPLDFPQAVLILKNGPIETINK